MRPDAWWAWEKSDGNLFGLFIGAPSFKIIKTATVIFPGGTLKCGAKKNSELI